MQSGLTITVLTENHKEFTFRLRECDFDKFNEDNLQAYIDAVKSTSKRENLKPVTYIVWENYRVGKFEELTTGFIQKQIKELKKQYGNTTQKRNRRKKTIKESLVC